tara:strand:- start:342 stop:593 length:252 start_codon:yes stop_codon:yes gene_type:complete
MANNTNPINNEIFDSYRLEVEKIHKAIRLLARQGYTVIDLEGQVITKWNVESGNYPNISYNRATDKVYLTNKQNEKHKQTEES